MRRYLLRKLLQAPLVLFALVTVSFFMMRLAPGGPFRSERAMDPAVRQALDVRYGLDRPLIVQYGRFLGGLVQGDLGPSFLHRTRSVNEVIILNLPPSLVLGSLALLVALLVGLGSGVIAAVRHNGIWDHTVMLIALGGLSVPTFVVGPLLQLVFSVHLQWLPVAEYGRGLLTPSHLLLPALTLGLPFAARLSRLARAGMLEVLNQDWIRTARAKGLSETAVILGHGLRGGLLPVVAYLGPAVATILTGSLVVERIFQIPGLGRCFVDNAVNRDYTVVMGTVIVYGTMIVICNLLADVVHALLDPRVGHG